ncbi:hypothetical protein ABT218_28870 [Streptomyces sp. NPDC001455]|uniref:hypothetical protein n=1 Tax=unclassified Streptomyces TaxID=2593676 RepID=UPI00332C51ED
MAPAARARCIRAGASQYGAIEYITKGPNRKRQGGTSYKQWAYAGKYNCRKGSCRLVKQYKVVVAVQESKKHSGRDGKPKGVITGYCEGVVRCPAWVSTTLNKQTPWAGPSYVNAAFTKCFESGSSTSTGSWDDHGSGEHHFAVKVGAVSLNIWVNSLTVSY